jgi:hypothetical protein
MHSNPDSIWQLQPLCRDLYTAARKNSTLSFLARPRNALLMSNTPTQACITTPGAELALMGIHPGMRLDMRLPAVPF